jgi:hypothetical protein
MNHRELIEKTSPFMALTKKYSRSGYSRTLRTESTRGSGRPARGAWKLPEVLIKRSVRDRRGNADLDKAIEACAWRKEERLDLF